MYPFKPGSFAVMNGWYVAAFAQDVGRDPVARTICGLPVALYRKADGTAVAVGGRCPHRHYPLGKSCVRGDEIVCGYHGIAFGPDGQCTDIPSQDFVPRAYRIPTYPLVEHGLWLWIWPGDADKADPSLLPDLEAIGYAGLGLEPVALFSHEVPCRYQLLNDNLLDLTHLAFLHGSSIGTIDNARARETVTHGPGVLRSHRLIEGGEPMPAIRQDQNYHGPVDSVVGMDFHLPGFHAGIGDHWAVENGERRPLRLSRVFHSVTPSTPTSCYYLFAMGAASGQSAEAMRAFLAPVIDEDIFASVEIEKMIALAGGDPPELMTRSDRGAVEGRRLLQTMMDAEQAERQAREAA